MLREIANSKGTKIENKIADDDIIISDKNILSIILHNLISNSAKFTQNGIISISSEYGDSVYKIIIADNGKGMHPEQLERIRTINNQNFPMSVNPASGENGNGLGYLIITELVELLKGKLQIESSYGKGTRVEIILPLQI